MEQTNQAAGVSLQGGLHLPAARLWLNGDTSQGLGFLSQFDAGRRRRSRIVCSQPLAALLGDGGATPLAVPFERPFQLGPIAVELLPAGASPGSALLRTHIGARTWLFAGAARLDVLPTAEPLALRETDVLVLDAQLAEAKLLSCAQLRAALDEALAMVAAGATLVWLIGQATVALDVLAWGQAHVPVHLAPSFATLARRYRRAGGSLPPGGSAHRQRPPGRLVLWPDAELRRLPPDLARARRWLVAEVADAKEQVSRGCERGLAFSRRASGMELDDLAQASGTSHVAAYGVGAQALCTRLAARGLTCSVLGGAQLRLV